MKSRSFAGFAVFVEVLVVYAKKMNEVVSYSSELLFEFQKTFANRNFRDGEMSYVSNQKILKHAQPNQIREALMKGYVEMSHINLTICSECLHAEYEAEHMVERLVSGG